MQEGSFKLETGYCTVSMLFHIGSILNCLEALEMSYKHYVASQSHASHLRKIMCFSQDYFSVTYISEYTCIHRVSEFTLLSYSITATGYRTSSTGIKSTMPIPPSPR